MICVILVQLDHGELLLQGAVSQLLCHHSLLLNVLIPSLVVRDSVDHLAEVGTLLFRLRVMPRWWLSESHGSVIVIHIAAVDVAVAVTIEHLVAIHKDQVRSLFLFYALGERVLLLSKGQLGALVTLSSLSTAHRGVDNILETARMAWRRLTVQKRLRIVARGRASRGTCGR